MREKVVSIRLLIHKRKWFCANLTKKYISEVKTDSKKGGENLVKATKPNKIASSIWMNKHLFQWGEQLDT